MKTPNIAVQTAHSAMLAARATATPLLAAFKAANPAPTLDDSAEKLKAHADGLEAIDKPVAEATKAYQAALDASLAFGLVLARNGRTFTTVEKASARKAKGESVALKFPGTPADLATEVAFALVYGATPDDCSKPFIACLPEAVRKEFHTSLVKELDGELLRLAGSVLDNEDVMTGADSASTLFVERFNDPVTRTVSNVFNPPAPGEEGKLAAKCQAEAQKLFVVVRPLKAKVDAGTATPEEKALFDEKIVEYRKLSHRAKELLAMMDI